jgi:phospholipid transport system substrate-binding protein
MLLVLTVFAVSLLGAKPSDPVELIKTKDRQLQQVLRQGKISMSPERREKVKQLINGIFDFQELGRKALGSAKFKTLTEDQQQRFIKAFKMMIENSSLKKLEVYKSDSTIYEKPVYKKGKVEITAHTYFDGQESILEYKMHVKDGEWKAWDLVIDDLSTYRNYKEQFTRILKKKTVEDLIKLLEDKAAGEKNPREKASPSDKTRKSGASPEPKTEKKNNN